MFRAIILGVVAAFTLGGCKGNLVMPGNVGPEPLTKPVDPNIAAHVGYLARHLLNADERELYVRLYENIEWAPSGQSSQEANYLPEAITIGLAVADGVNPFDPANAGKSGRIGLGLTVGEGLLRGLAKASAPRVGWLYIPKSIADDLDEYPADRYDEGSKRLRAWARDYMTKRLQVFAIDTGYAVKCIHNCTGNTPLWEFSRITAHPERPKRLYATVVMFPLLEPDPDDSRDQALGWAPAWESSLPYGWVMHLGTRVPRDSEGKIEFKQEIQGPIVTDIGGLSYDSDLGVRFLKSITGGPGYLVQGHARGQVFAVRGSVYRLGRKALEFVQAEMVPRDSSEGKAVMTPN